MTPALFGGVESALCATVVAVGCMGDAEGGREQTTSASPAISTLREQRALPPSDFTADAAAFQVVLSWVPPPEEIESYAIYRDGLVLARGVPGSQTRFTDKTAGPNSEYTYEIEAVAANGMASDRIAVDAETVEPPLRAARFANDYAVRVRFVSKSGYGDYDVSNYGWSFRPRCKQGVCDVIWRDLHEREARARLARRGVHYRGSYTGFFGLECGGAKVTSSVTIALEVTMGRVVGGKWVATRFKGTVDQAEAAQLGCRSSEGKLAVSGRLVR